MSGDVPNPGSPAAQTQGCTCPVLDNARGDPRLGDTRGFYVTKGCPLHADDIEWNDNDD